MSFWLIDWLQKKKRLEIGNWKLKIVLIIAMYLLVLVPLYFGKSIGRSLNTIVGIDKILFGTAIGSLFFLLGKSLDERVRKIKGKQLFIYQKVVFPVSLLFLSSIILNFIITRFSL